MINDAYATIESVRDKPAEPLYTNQEIMYNIFSSYDIRAVFQIRINWMVYVTHPHSGIIKVVLFSDYVHKN